MPLAEWSGEGAVEYEQNMGFAMKIGQANRLVPKIFQGEIRGEGIDGNFRHMIQPFAVPNLHPVLRKKNAAASVSATKPKAIQVGMATAETAACLIEIPASAHRMTAA